MDLGHLLDATPARRPPYRRLLAEAWSLVASHPPPPGPLPRGRGQRVLVVPAFLANDLLMRNLRRFLQTQGFSAFGWGLGVNWGPTPRILAGLQRRLDALATEGPVALVGVSMGGVLARNLAYDRPRSISHVVTVASPFRLPAATTIGPLVRLCAPRYSAKVDAARLRQPLPVPATAIWTRDDGIVDPGSCWTEGGQAVEVGGPHLTICRRAETLATIVAALAAAPAE